MQVGAEAGAEGEVRVEVRGEGTAQTDPRKSKLQQQKLLPNCRGQSTKVSVGIICLEAVLWKVVERVSSRYVCGILTVTEACIICVGV